MSLNILHMEGQGFEICVFSQSELPNSDIQSHKGINPPIQCETVIAFLNPQQAGKVNYVFAGSGFEHVTVCLCNMENRLFKFFKLFCGSLMFDFPSPPLPFLTYRPSLSNRGEGLDVTVWIIGNYWTRQGCLHRGGTQTACFEPHADGAPM